MTESNQADEKAVAVAMRPRVNRIVIASTLLGLIPGTGCSRSVPAQPKSIMIAPATSKLSLSLTDSAELRRDPDNGTLQSLKAPNLAGALAGNAQFHCLIDAKRWEEAALFFLAAISDQLKLKDPASELRLESLLEDELGFHHLKFRQIYRSLPVWGTELQVHWRGDGALYLINGRYIPTPENIDITPAISPQRALGNALETVGESVTKIQAEAPVELGVYPQQGKIPPLLTYRAILPAGLTGSWQILIDAKNGRLLDKIQVLR